MRWSSHIRSGKGGRGGILNINTSSDLLGLEGGSAGLLGGLGGWGLLTGGLGGAGEAGVETTSSESESPNGLRSSSASFPCLVSLIFCSIVMLVSSGVGELKGFESSACADGTGMLTSSSSDLPSRCRFGGSGVFSDSSSLSPNGLQASVGACTGLAGVEGDKAGTESLLLRSILGGGAGALLGRLGVGALPFL